MPDDTGSKQFEPDGYFLVLISGPIAHPLTIHAIPTVLLNETDADEYWTEIQPGFTFTDACKASGFESLPGITVEMRAADKNQCYIQWGYGPNPVWSAKMGGLS